MENLIARIKGRFTSKNGEAASTNSTASAASQKRPPHHPKQLTKADLIPNKKADLESGSRIKTDTLVDEYFDFNEAAKSLGNFGRWQVQLVLLLAAVVVFDTLVSNMLAFTAFTPKHRCNIPFCEHPDNSTFEGKEQVNLAWKSRPLHGRPQQRPRSLRSFVEVEHDLFPYYVRQGIPDDLLDSGRSCHYYGIANISPQAYETSVLLNKESCQFYLSELKRNSTDLRLMQCDYDSLLFDTNTIADTLITSFKLVCDRAWIVTAFAVLFDLASCLGALLFGLLSDKIGRLKTLLISILGTSILGVIAAFVRTNVSGYGFFKFCIGLTSRGLFTTAFILAFETCGPTWALTLFLAKFLGQLILSLTAFTAQNWVTLHLAIFTPSLFLLPLLAFFMPESPRWQITVKGHFEKARNTCKKAALLNGREIRLQVLHPFSTKRTTNSSSPPSANGNGNGGCIMTNGQNKGQKQQPLVAFENVEWCKDSWTTIVTQVALPSSANKKNGNERSSEEGEKAAAKAKNKANRAEESLVLKEVREWVLNLAFQWFTLGFCLKALSGSSGLYGLHGLYSEEGKWREIADPYAELSYAAFTGLPGILATLVLGISWGPRPLLTFSHASTGLLTFISGLGLHFAIHPLARFGHVVAVMSFYSSLAAIYLVSAEIMATSVRATFLGLWVAFFGVGSIMGTAVITNTTLTVMWLPGVVTAILALISAFLAFKLPDTSERPLPEKWSSTLDLRNVPRRSYSDFPTSVIVWPFRLKAISSIFITPKKLCKSIENSIYLRGTDFTNHKSGFMYACSISDAKQNITEICELPHIEEKGGLETITAVGIDPNDSSLIPCQWRCSGDFGRARWICQFSPDLCDCIRTVIARLYCTCLDCFCILEPLCPCLNQPSEDDQVVCGAN